MGRQVLRSDLRSWILLDSSGREMVVDVDKRAIMRRTQIHARDLRILDPGLSYPSTILGRQTAILLNLEHIKAIITSEEVLLRDPLDDNIIPIVEDLRRRLRPQHNVEADEEDDSPFEFRALEVALEAICSFLSARTIELETAVYPALDMLTSKICCGNLDRIRKLKSQMTRLSGRVQRVRDEIENLLDDDDDMAHLYLSRNLSSPVSCFSTASASASRETLSHIQELEMLLEAYFVKIDTTMDKLDALREYIDSTEDYINIQLDNRRNQLIQLELFLSTGTLCLSIYSLVTAIFGMNIPYTWNNNHGYVFKWVVICPGIFCLILFTLVMSYARSLSHNINSNKM